MNVSILSDKIISNLSVIVNNIRLIGWKKKGTIDLELDFFLVSMRSNENQVRAVFSIASVSWYYLVDDLKRNT
jgi:hypothetical protein